MNTQIPKSKMKLPSAIESERLILRKPRIEDAETIFLTFFGDEAVNRYMDKAPSVDLAETCRIIARFIQAWENNERFEYVIEHKETRKIIGIIGIRNPHNSDSLAYAISKQFIGKNYLNEAVKVLIESSKSLPMSHSKNDSSSADSLTIENQKSKLAQRFERTLRHRIFNRNHKKGTHRAFNKAS
ncbi:GNAT family N-acetyltransferase [Puniceicoccaceae bacterium K14]|nr:GNAT family N-acetyltransferase [Puniceicoccaceae bacterium K14]